MGGNFICPRRLLVDIVEERYYIWDELFMFLKAVLLAVGSDIEKLWVKDLGFPLNRRSSSFFLGQGFDWCSVVLLAPSSVIVSLLYKSSSTVYFSRWSSVNGQHLQWLWEVMQRRSQPFLSEVQLTGLVVTTDPSASSHFAGVFVLS